MKIMNCNPKIVKIFVKYHKSPKNSKIFKNITYCEKGYFEIHLSKSGKKENVVGKKKLPHLEFTL